MVVFMKDEQELKINILLSGGIDSSIMALLYKKERFDVHPLFIDYGQRAGKQEWNACKKICLKLHLHNPMRIPVCSISKLHKNLLTSRSSKVESPFFPFRNLILISIAALYAYESNCNNLAIGIVGRGAVSFPDCSQEFISSLSKSLSLAVNSEIRVFTPLIGFSKGDIINYGSEYGFPYKLTYSCYLGGIKHCGQCAACKSRKEAFKASGIKDPTEYKE